VNGTGTVDIGNGPIAASITEAAIAGPGLATCVAVTVIVKASDVLIGK